MAIASYKAYEEKLKGGGLQGKDNAKRKLILNGTSCTQTVWLYDAKTSTN
jgi:hypothetical protein